MSETLLLDANVLIALSFTDHLHHELMTNWFKAFNPRFATCPITQGALVQFSMRHIPNDSEAAKSLLSSLVSMQGHEFWADDLPCTSLPWPRIFGHRQVTDAYLVSLAKHCGGGRLATLDVSMATVFPEVLLITL